MDPFLSQTVSINSFLNDWELVGPHASLGLHPPPIGFPTSLSVSILQMVLAVGRGVCSRTAPPALVRAQFLSSYVALRECCDCKGGLLHINAVIEHLNETKQNAIAHDLGVGLSSLLMQQAGHAWSGLTEDHIVPSVANGFASGSCPDLIFDPGSGVAEYTVVESKGSTPPVSRWASGNLKKRLRIACTKQVANVLGATTVGGSLISRGLAIGLIGMRGGPPVTFGVVEAVSPHHQPSMPAKPLSAATPFPDRNAPTARIAVRHYIGALRLIGADNLAHRLLICLLHPGLLAEAKLETGSPRVRLAEVRMLRGQKFVIGHLNDPVLVKLMPFLQGRRFALPLKIVRHLDQLALSESIEADDYRAELPLEGIRGLFRETIGSETHSFVDHDGLALLSSEDLEEDGDTVSV